MGGYGLESYAEKELRNCTFVKTILMLLVVFYHSIVFWGGGWFTKNPVFQASGLSMGSKWLNSFHIYGFALVSGYIFYHLKYEKGRYQAFRPFVANKAKRLLIPYATVLLLWVLPIQYGIFRYDGITVIKNYILGISPNQLWFLLMLFNVFVLAWLLSDRLVKNNVVAAVIAAGAAGIGLVGPNLLPNVFMIWQAFYYLPIFILGMKLRQYGTACIRRIPVLAWIALDVLLFAVYQLTGGFGGIYMRVLRMALNMVLHAVGAVMAFVTLQKIADRLKPDGKIFRFLSKNSMVVYLLHQQLIYFFILGLNGLVNPYINGLVNFVGSLLISLLASHMLLKFKITRFLLGEK